MGKLLYTSLLLCALPASAATYYIRADGGTRYSVNVPAGQCDGLADVAYPGSGTNQHCAFNDVLYLWNDNTQHASAWVPAGGDTVIIRQKSGGWRIGSPVNTDNSPFCGVFGTPAGDCVPPPIPSGTSLAHTRILSTCGAAGNCQPDANTVNPKVYESSLTQLFSGYGATRLFDLAGSQYVDIEGFELTTHNGTCSIIGSPRVGGGCSTSSPWSDYGVVGIRTDNTTANVTFQDVYIHGFATDGLHGPIGGPINMLRVFSGFNGNNGYQFDDGSGTPDAPGSALNWTHTFWIGNGCVEEYPISHTFPALACYDIDSGGFGDSISGQGGAGVGSVLDTIYMDDYEAILNTKDGFIGPHVGSSTVTIKNSISAFNMGQQWKWGGIVGTPENLTFTNNLTVAGCARMSAAMSSGPFGWTAPSGYNTHLSDFCRAGGGTIDSVISAGSTWTMNNNTFIFPSLGTVLLDPACPGGTSSCASTIHWFNNAVMSYPSVPAVTFSGSSQSLFYNANNPSQIAITCDHEVEFDGTGSLGAKCVTDGSINVTAGAGVHFSDPLFLNEPPQSVTAQSALDVFTNFVNTTSFYPTNSSPMNGAGTTGAPSTDYFGVDQTSPPVIGAVVIGGTPANNTGSVLLNIIMQGTLTK